MGLPGEDEVETELPASMGSPRLEDVEDLGRFISEDDIESLSTACESRMR